MFGKRFEERGGIDETIEALQVFLLPRDLLSFYQGKTNNHLYCLHSPPGVAESAVPEQQRRFCLPEQVAVAAARSPGVAVVAAAPAGTRVAPSP